jgi:hypothetical protein
MEFSQPPPDITPQMPNFANPPPINRILSYQHPQPPKQPNYFKPHYNNFRGPGGIPMTQDDFDGKRLRKSVMRKTVDYNASIIKALEVKFILFSSFQWNMYLKDACLTWPIFLYLEPNLAARSPGSASPTAGKYLHTGIAAAAKLCGQPQ